MCPQEMYPLLWEAILYPLCRFQGPNFSAPASSISAPVQAPSLFSVAPPVLALQLSPISSGVTMGRNAVFGTDSFFLPLFFQCSAKPSAEVSGDFLVVASGLMSTFTSAHAVSGDVICILQVTVQTLILPAHTLLYYHLQHHRELQKFRDL